MADPHLSTRPLPDFARCVGVEWNGLHHRVWLDYEITDLHPRSGAVAVCMLNPSGASETTSDATITRLLGLLRDHPVAGTLRKRVRIVNRWTLRATKPEDLIRVENPGRMTDWLCLAGIDHMIVGWGKPSDHRIRKRLDQGGPDHVRAWRDLDLTLHAFALTPDGYPRHPLMLPASSAPRPVDHIGGGRFRWSS